MTANAPPNRANYVVKRAKTVVAGSDVRARMFTLAPGEVIPWHSHSQITDYFFVLNGSLTVETRAPEHRHILIVGERFHVAPGTAHQTSNREAADCRFLLIQGVGRYDWINE